MMYSEFYDWMIEVKRLSPNSSRQYARRIEQLTLELNAPEKITSEQLHKYLQTKESSVSNHNHWVAAVLKYLEFADIKFENTDFLKIKSSPKRLPKPLSVEDIDKICLEIPIGGPTGLRDRAIVETLYCGLRNSECANLRIGNMEEHVVRIVGKGDKERIAPINKVAWGFLIDHVVKSYLPPEEYEQVDIFGQEYVFAKIRHEHPTQPVFLAENGNCIYPRAIHRIIEHYAKQAGVTAHPHMFRHSAATHILDEGLGNIIALKDALGHSSLDTTNLYVQVSDRSRKLLNSFHPRERQEI